MKSLLSVLIAACFLVEGWGSVFEVGPYYTAIYEKGFDPVRVSGLNCCFIIGEKNGLKLKTDFYLKPTKKFVLQEFSSPFPFQRRRVISLEHPVVFSKPIISPCIGLSKLCYIYENSDEKVCWLASEHLFGGAKIEWEKEKYSCGLSIFHMLPGIDYRTCMRKYNLDRNSPEDNFISSSECKNHMFAIKPIAQFNCYDWLFLKIVSEIQSRYTFEYKQFSITANIKCLF